MSEDRPAWARRITRERESRNLSQADVITAMRMHAQPKGLPDDASMLRQFKRWESGEHMPGEYYQTLIAATFGTVTHAIFPATDRREGSTDILAASGMDTLELVSRWQSSDVDGATLDAMRLAADQLCSDYPFVASDELLIEARNWLRRLNVARDGHLTLAQHREVLVLAGWLTLLIGCVEYDSGLRHQAETTRRAALSMGTETDNTEISAWAHEIRAWMALTTGDYHGVAAAAQHGLEAAPHHGVAVQLAAQEAKAWARLGDRRQTEVALDRGRRLLDSMPYPENLDHHFVVDPTKFDFYAMDCYRHLGDDRIAESLATEVIDAATDFDGTERAPMRIAEARLTLGVVAARQGELELAIQHGEHALSNERKSLPSLIMVSRDLTRVLKDRYPNEPVTKTYLEELTAISHAAELGRPTRTSRTSELGK
jgi:transcriptional regulator with XRE-family HTH domain